MKKSCVLVSGGAGYICPPTPLGILNPGAYHGFPPNPFYNEP